MIEENTEKLDLLEKTLLIEEKQKKRLQGIMSQNEKEKEEAARIQLFEGNNATTMSMLDQEESQRKELMDGLIRNSTPNAPVVKVLNSIQGTDPDGP